MTIAMITRPAAGNALRVFLQPPTGASHWRLLRKLTNDFVGEADPAAALVHDGRERCVLDADALENGVLYFYRAYYRVGLAWMASNVSSTTPTASYEDLSVDVQTIVRDRLAAGLAVELARGRLTHEDGAIPVLTAPPATDQARWPLVTIHMSNEDPSQRHIGEQAGSDEFDVDADKWQSAEGWLAKTQLSIVGWSLNSDERLELRKALRRIVIANLEVFESHGFVNVEFSQQDMEDFESYNAPVYQAACTFYCMAPVAVGSTADVIRDVTQQISI